MSKSPLLPPALKELHSAVGEVELECKLVCTVCHQNKGNISNEHLFTEHFLLLIVSSAAKSPKLPQCSSV